MSERSTVSGDDSYASFVAPALRTLSRIENSAPNDSGASRSGSTTTATRSGTRASLPSARGPMARSCSSADSSSRRCEARAPAGREVGDFLASRRRSIAPWAAATTSSNGTARSYTETIGSGPVRYTLRHAAEPKRSTQSSQGSS